MEKGYLTSSGVADLGKLKILCREWLFDNFGIKAEITKSKILKQRNVIDIESGLVGVAFEFECPDGKIGDSVAFLDRNLVEDAVIASIFKKVPTTERAQVWM
jgi:hypothetical protein